MRTTFPSYSPRSWTCPSRVLALKSLRVVMGLLGAGRGWVLGVATSFAFEIPEESLVVVRSLGAGRERTGRVRGSPRVPAVDRPEDAVQHGGEEQQVHDEADHPTSV